MDTLNVFCHILTSLNGKISGPFMENEITKFLYNDYRRIRDEYNPDAVIYGTQTMKDFVGTIDKKKLTNNAPVGPNFLNILPNLPFLFSIDSNGELDIKENKITIHGIEYQVVQVLTYRTSAAYKNYLQSHGITYITAGVDYLDPYYFLRMVYSYFPVNNILLAGGGKINLTFLEAGLISKLSLVISPVVDNKKGAPSVFDPLKNNDYKSYSFMLKEVEELEHGGLHVIYENENTNFNLIDGMYVSGGMQ